MRRRSFLAAAGTAVALSGCMSREGAPPTGEGTTTPSTADDQPTTADGPDDSSTTETASVGDAFAVTNVSTTTFSRALRLNDLGRAPIGGVTERSSLDDRARSVVDAAIAGGYETDEVPDWLAAFADDTHVVATEDAIYTLDATLPTYTIRASETSEDAVDGPIADAETYREAVTHDGVVMTGLVRIAARDGVTFYHVWDDLDALLTEYDAVEYRTSLYELTVEVDDPGAPYTITATEPSIEALADGPVVRADEQSTGIRDHLVAAANTEGVYAFDDAPDGLIDLVENTRYVYHDGRFYAAYVEADSTVPVDIVAAPAEPTTDGRPTLEIGVLNDAETPHSVMSGAPRPLGYLTYEPVDVDGSPPERPVLWTDAYEESDHVHVSDGEVTAINAIGLVTEYVPGEERTDVYAVRGEPAPGTYRVRDEVGVESAGQTLPYAVQFDVIPPEDADAAGNR